MDIGACPGSFFPMLVPPCACPSRFRERGEFVGFDQSYCEI